MAHFINRKPQEFDDSLLDKIIEERYAEREKKRLETLQSLTEKLKSHFSQKGFKKVYIFGSILKAGEFHDFSDIDIAVEGLTGDYFRVCADAEEIIGREIEVVEIEKCKFRDSIEKYGLRVI